ncbi:MAG TPA: vWA domain-containing protein [Polyangiaceae bacterium]|jgi:hypothetical protein|nr:vWA domain-containing protein [Polyangiaceae bacterium]
MSTSQWGSRKAAKFCAKKRGFLRLLAWLSVGSGLVLAPACGVRMDSLDKTSLDTASDDAKLKVEAVMREVFPDLTDDEIHTYSTNLTLDTAIALEAEITNMRSLAGELSKDLEDAASAAAMKRKTDLASHNDGFPTGLESLGRGAFYDSAHGSARVDLSGVFSDHSEAQLASSEISVSVGGTAQTVQVSCASAEPVDIVFLVDVTGSMTPVIGAVQRSLQQFVSAIVEKGVSGTLGVVTFQDSVGVNIEFQQPLGASGYERSPFYPPVDIADASGIAKLQRFIARLEADSGADIPENLGGAIDFAQNNVIGLMKNGAPNVIGDGIEDPMDVAPWPKPSHARHIFIAFTDAPFHSDSRDATNSSLLPAFKPRPIASILRTLQSGGTTVHVSDPSWVDETVEPTGAAGEVDVDSDYWAIQTGGLGEDKIVGYSPIDLDLLVLAEDSGLLDILLDSVVATSCSAQFPLPSLTAAGSFDLQISHGGQTYTNSLLPIRY